MRQNRCRLPFMTALFFILAFFGCGTSRPPAETITPPAVSPGLPSQATRNETPPSPAAPDNQQTFSADTTQATAPAGSYAVQLGAFKQQESANLIASLAKNRYNQTVSVTYDNSAALYKVSIGSFASKDEARLFRDTMVQQYPTDYKDAWVSEIPPK